MNNIFRKLGLVDSFGVTGFGGVIILIIILGSVIMGARAIDNVSCSNYSQMSGNETEYKVMTCYVRYEDGFIPYEEYKARVTASDLNK